MTSLDRLRYAWVRRIRKIVGEAEKLVNQHKTGYYVPMGEAFVVARRLGEAAARGEELAARAVSAAPRAELNPVYGDWCLIAQIIVARLMDIYPQIPPYASKLRASAAIEGVDELIEKGVKE